MKATVVIPNLNGERFLKDCLDSLFDQSFRDFDVVLVDNNSSDGSIELVKSLYPEVEVIRNKANLGFARAVNQGIAKASGNYIVLLNNDTVLEREWLASLVEAADASGDEFMFFASKILRMEDERIIESTGDSLGFTGMPYPLNYEEIDDGRFEKPFPVFSACAAGALYKRKLFDEIGLFDEDFFAYHEDTDLCFRAQLRGFKGLFVPKARMYHRVGGTSSRIGDFERYYGTRNFAFLIIKNMPASLMARSAHKLAFVQAVFLMRAIKRLSFGPLLKAHASTLKNVPRLLKKRREIQKRRVIETSYLRNATDLKKPLLATLMKKLLTRGHSWFV